MLLLALPLHVAVCASGDSAVGWEVVLRVRALLALRTERVVRRSGGAAPSVPSAASAPPAEPGPAAPAAAQRPAGRARRALRARLRRSLLRIEVLERVLASRALRIARPRGWLVFGSADPAETGQAFGWACAVAALVDPGGAVRLAPLWTFEDRVAGELTLDLRIVPLRLAGAVVAALAARPGAVRRAAA